MTRDPASRRVLRPRTSSRPLFVDGQAGRRAIAGGGEANKPQSWKYQSWRFESAKGGGNSAAVAGARVSHAFCGSASYWSSCSRRLSTVHSCAWDRLPVSSNWCRRLRQ
ncbi:hypothetical protein BN2475_270059 [Paraburkholderia ribeironis]|uniref:Uncharacterized protein n=1 Tax=Paraburkholderia ribeironis TaxID=1247936 RepID=A0A1N7RZY1_9BURK|nr:hypothetical protein BN2475_270059 [Paraburkholderia ribeironis]